MKNFEEFQITKTTHLKRPTIFFYLKNSGFSENHIKHLRSKNGNILLNGKMATVRDKIMPGDNLSVSNFATAATNLPLAEEKLNILFEDDDFLIVNKPHDLTCTPTRSHFADNLGAQICTYMQSKNPDFVLRVLNRLDREAAGIVVVAKNLFAYSNIKIDKTYHALCHDSPKAQTINFPIKTETENGINKMKRVVCADGKPAITHIKPIKTVDLSTSTTISLVQVKIETGRTHQIRVHMSAIGNPLVFDSLYGNPQKDSLVLECVKQKKPAKTCAMLLLKTISFTHFRTQQQIVIDVPYPKEWNFLK